MLKQELDTLNYELDRPLPNEKHKKIIQLIKDEFDGKITNQFRALTAKTHSCLTDSKNEDKKPKGTKKCFIKRRIKFKDYNLCLEAIQFGNEMNQPDKNKSDVDSLTENHKQFIINNKLILKSQNSKDVEREKLIAFTEGINNIALSANHEKRIQPIDSIETYAYGTNKDLVCKKEEIKRNNIIKYYKNN